MEGQVAIGLRDVVMLCSILGAAIGFWRFYSGRKADAVEVAIWRKGIEHRLENAEKYSKRIEDERKTEDTNLAEEIKLLHATTMEVMKGGFDRLDASIKDVSKDVTDLTARVTRLEVSLAEHRKSCEGRKQ